MNGKNDSFPIAGLLDAGTLTSVLLALFYTAGAAYAYYFFGHFHLPVPGMDMPRSYFFFYGFKVVKNNLAPVFFCIVSSIALYYFLRSLWQRTAEQNKPTESNQQRHRRAVLLRASTFIGGLTYLLLLFMIFTCLGYRKAQSEFTREQGNDFPSYPRVRVWVNGEQDDSTKAWVEGCYRLLLRTREYLYLFPTDGTNNLLPTDIIPTNRIRAVEILPLYRSPPACRESCIKRVPLS